MASPAEQTIQHQINEFKRAVNEAFIMAKEQPIAFLNIDLLTMYVDCLSTNSSCLQITDLGSAHLLIVRNNLAKIKEMNDTLTLDNFSSHLLLPIYVNFFKDAHHEVQGSASKHLSTCAPLRDAKRMYTALTM